MKVDGKTGQDLCNFETEEGIVYVGDNEVIQERMAVNDEWKSKEETAIRTPVSKRIIKAWSTQDIKTWKQFRYTYAKTNEAADKEKEDVYN